MKQKQIVSLPDCQSFGLIARVLSFLGEAKESNAAAFVCTNQLAKGTTARRHQKANTQRKTSLLKASKAVRLDPPLSGPNVLPTAHPAAASSERWL